MKGDEHVVIDFAGPRKSLVLAPEEQLPMVRMNCGASYTFALPSSVGMAAAACKQFVREHRRCRPIGPRQRVSRSASP